jgi:hypothetical protein
MRLNTDSARRTSAALEAHYQFNVFAAWQRMTRLAHRDMLRCGR